MVRYPQRGQCPLDMPSQPRFWCTRNDQELGRSVEANITNSIFMIIYDQVTLNACLIDNAKNKHATIHVIILGYNDLNLETRFLDNKFDILVKTTFVFATNNQKVKGSNLDHPSRQYHHNRGLVNRKLKEIIPLFLRASDLVLPSSSKNFIKVRRRNFKSYSLSFYVSPDSFNPNQVLSVNIKSFNVLNFLNL